jgi:hypothetical protein
LPQEAEAEPEIVKQILSYFVRNSTAADTLEGITRWRLQEEQIHRSLQQTDAALAWLVSQGLLQEVLPAGSPRLFRLNPERHGAAIHFLAREDKPEGKK